ncbi:MAG: hypothetical protein JSS81_27175 [Acidobacteria bacterium]|nr:hypothetical protein [Acidobacteriota bacterium]
MKRLLIFKFIVLVLFVFPAFAQTGAQIEKELVAAIKEVRKYSDYGSNYDGDKLSAANRDFEEKLVKYTKKASTLAYKFPVLAKSIFIATSDDGRLRVYSWDLEGGGTMHEFGRVYQFRGADGKVYSRGEEPSEEEDGAGSFVTDVYSVAAKKGTAYVVCSTFIGSTQDHYQSATGFRIDGDKLVDKVELFRTKEGLTDALSFEYNFFSVVDRRERPVRLILYDKKTKSLRIPVVVNDKKFPNGRVTNRFITYRFDGEYFVKVK